jgi:hypothetical protein
VESGAAAAIADERRSPEAARGDGVDVDQSQSVISSEKGTPRRDGAGVARTWAGERRAEHTGRSVGAGGGRASSGLGGASLRGGVGAGVGVVCWTGTGGWVADGMVCIIVNRRRRRPWDPPSRDRERGGLGSAGTLPIGRARA